MDFISSSSRVNDSGSNAMHWVWKFASQMVYCPNNIHNKIKLRCKLKILEYCMSLQAGCYCSPPNLHIYITHIYSGEIDKCGALVTRNNEIKLFVVNCMNIIIFCSESSFYVTILFSVLIVVYDNINPCLVVR